MRADRLIATMLLLQQRGRMSSRAIAGVLEVSPRTVMRDIEALGAAGVPIYSVRGPEGGYQLWEGFRADLTGLTAQEAGALPLWGHSLAADVLGRVQHLLALRCVEAGQGTIPARHGAGHGPSFGRAFRVAGGPAGHRAKRER